MRAPRTRTVSRLGRLRQLSNGFGVFPLSRTSARHGPSATRDCSRQRVRRYLSTLPSDCCCLSSRQRVRYCLFSRQRVLPLLPPETARAREYAATSPLSRATAAAFPLASEYDTASSPARDYTCVCVCFILCDGLPYTAYVESPALAWCLYQVPIVSQSCE